jgi:hypothetical protein
MGELVSLLFREQLRILQFDMDFINGGCLVILVSPIHPH